MWPFKAARRFISTSKKKLLQSWVALSGNVGLQDINILTWNKKALQVLWMALLFVALMVVVKEPISLITSPHVIDDASPEAPLDLSFLVANQQIGSLKELIIMNNFPTNKWIVVDGLTSRCNNVTSFTQSLEWRVVFVVSKWESYVTGCRFPRCVIISEQNMEIMLGESTFTKISQKLTKLAGYLFAIRQGAETIMDISCDKQSQFNAHFLNIGQDHGPHSYELLQNESTLFDAFQHYGYKSLSSTSFSSLKDALEATGTSTGLQNTVLNRSDIFYLQHMREDYIKQSVSICYRSCGRYEKHASNREPFSTIPVSIGAYTIGVLDSGPTMFHKNAFLSMFVPEDVPQTQQQMFRSLFIHGVRSFTYSPIRYYPIINDSSSCHCVSYGEVGSVKLDEYKLLSYITWVREGGCYKYTDILHCTMNVLSRVLNILKSRSFSLPKWKRSTRALLLAWLDDLGSSGPDDVYFENKSSQGNGRHYYDTNATKMYYAFHKYSWSIASSSQKSRLQTSVFDKMKNVCANISKSQPVVSLSSWERPLLEDVMLIIVMNYESLFTTTPYLEYVHRMFFKYIVYCGPGVESFIKYAKDHGFPYITYIHGLTRGWKYMYECTTHAMRLGMPVKGYLQIGDDTLINPMKFLRIDKDTIWVPGGYDKKNFYETKDLEYWGHWGKDHGRRAIINIFNELHNVSMTDKRYITIEDKKIPVSQEYRSFAQRFLQTYDRNIGIRNAVHRAMDIFYIPENVKSDFLLAAEVFIRHGSIIEMAIPIINFGLVPKTKIQFLKGASLWRQDRLKPWLLFDVETMSFLHPFKSLLHLGQQEGQEFFCKAFLPNLFNYTYVSKQQPAIRVGT